MLGKIFGSDKAVQGLRDGIDAAVFTQEERARHHIELLKAYHPFRIAQRVIAFSIVIPFVSVVMYGIALITIGTLSSDNGLILASKDSMSILSDTMGSAFVIVVLFYFGGGAIESYKRNEKQD